MANTEILNRKDALTGFHTKEGLNEYLNSRLTTVYSRPTSLSVIMLDLDNFKGINDKYGHLVGDDALRFFSMIINTALKGQHFVARYGGDEFVIVMPDSGNCKESFEIAKRIRANLQSEKFVTSAGSMRINTSIGIGNYPRDGQTGRALIEAADQALYYAKKHGKNRIINSGGLKNTSIRDKIFFGLKIIAFLGLIIISAFSFLSTGSLRGVITYFQGVSYCGRYEYNHLFKGYNYCLLSLKSGKNIEGWLVEERPDSILICLIKPVFQFTSISRMNSLQLITVPKEYIQSVIKSSKE